MNRESIIEHDKEREKGSVMEISMQGKRKRFITRENLYVLVNDRHFRSRVTLQGNEESVKEQRENDDLEEGGGKETTRTRCGHNILTAPHG